MTHNVTTRYANCAGLKAGSARFAIREESSEEALTTLNQPDNVMSVKNVKSVLMI